MVNQFAIDLAKEMVVDAASKIATPHNDVRERQFGDVTIRYIHRIGRKFLSVRGDGTWPTIAQIEALKTAFGVSQAEARKQELTKRIGDKTWHIVRIEW